MTVTRLAWETCGETKLKHENEFPLHLTVALVSDSVMIERVRWFYGPSYLLFILYHLIPTRPLRSIKIYTTSGPLKKKKTLFRWRFLSCRRGNWKLRFQELLLFNNAFNMMRSKSTLRGEILAFANLSFDQKFNSKAIYESARCCSEDNIKTYFSILRNSTIS